MKVNMNINDELLERVDKFAKSNYLTRTSVFTMAVNQYLLTYEIQSLMSEMRKAMQKIADTGTINDEQMKELNEFSKLCDMFNGRF